MYKVIMIDDDESILTSLSYTIDWAMHRCKLVATAQNAREGACLIEEHEPNILFTDIEMPEMDGLTMLAGLRQGFPDMQVTVLTDRRDFDCLHKALHLGVVRYLLKPAKMAELEEALVTMIHRLHRLDILPPREEGSDDVSNFIVRKAIAYIEQNCEKKISLADVAEVCFVSQWYLSKLFGKSSSQSFYDILNRARINRAKHLLEDPSLRIGTIAERVGYCDISHFSRVFKKFVGISANEYRNEKAGSMSRGMTRDL